MFLPGGVIGYTTTDVPVFVQWALVVVEMNLSVGGTGTGVEVRAYVLYARRKWGENTVRLYTVHYIPSEVVAAYRSFRKPRFIPAWWW